MKYNLIYSDKRKTVSISVKDGEVIVRAPRRTPKNIIEKYLNDHTDWIEKHLKKSVARKEKFDLLTDADIKKIKKQAKEYFTLKTEEYAKIMGLKYGRITITSAKTRFGSCSSKGNISYSYRLMLYPEAAREYVVVHELAHLLQMNHSPSFYEIVKSVLPDYKQRRQMLK